MTDRNLSQDPMADSPLAHVRQGMAVFDSNGEKVGEVRHIFFGLGDENIEGGTGRSPELDVSAVDDAGDDAFDASLEVARSPASTMPHTLRGRLEHQGYIRINTGLLSGDRFALPGQIASVMGERVNLNVRTDELIEK